MTDCSGFDLCQTNGSWYTNKTPRPERAIIPTGLLPSVVHYAVETEPAHYSPYTHVTIVPTYVNTISAVTSAGPVPQTRMALNGVISQNQSSINQILNSAQYRR